MTALRLASRPTRSRDALLLAILACIASGCAGLGRQVQHTPLPPGAPSVDSVLDSLTENDGKLQNFRAAGTFTVESPKLEAIEKFHSGTIAFDKPDRLYVVGRMELGIIAFRLVSVGPEFLIERPTARKPEERYYYQLEGEQFESVPFSVSPADIAREMFTPVDWLSYDRDRIRITSYDGETHTAVLELGPRRHPERRITVHGLPWVVVRNERLDEAGKVMAETTLDDYHEVDGIRFPAYVNAWFPSERTRMTFEMRNIRINTDQVTDDLFTIKWRPTDVEQSLSDDARGNRGILKP